MSSFSSISFLAEWKLFLSTFGIIFIAELPDKTALATVFLATRHRPVAVFGGVALAFLVQSTVAVGFGSLFAWLPARWVHAAAGALFLLFAFLMWRSSPESDDPTHGRDLQSKGFARTAWVSFVVIFLAEWGDFTQLATAALAAKYHHPFIILTAATSALWTVTGIAITVGHHAKRRIPTRRLEQAAAVIFGIVGVVMIAGAVTRAA